MCNTYNATKISPQSSQVLYVNLCPDWYIKKVLVIQSVVYCFGCEGKGGGGGGGGCA